MNLPALALLVASTVPLDLEGFASLGGGTSGGGVPPTGDAARYKVIDEATPTPARALQGHLQGTQPLVIELRTDVDLGALDNHDRPPLLGPGLIRSRVGIIRVGSNKTLFSARGATLRHGTLDLDGSRNVILRNLRFRGLWEWDEATRGEYDAAGMGLRGPARRAKRVDRSLRLRQGLRRPARHGARIGSGHHLLDPVRQRLRRRSRAADRPPRVPLPGGRRRSAHPALPCPARAVVDGRHRPVRDPAAEGQPGRARRRRGSHRRRKAERHPPPRRLPERAAAHAAHAVRQRSCLQHSRARRGARAPGRGRNRPSTRRPARPCSSRTASSWP